MSLPVMTGVGRLIEDPELKFAPSGMAICRLRLAFNSRKKDESTGQWADDKTFFVDGTAFKQVAENIAESLTRSMEVCVTGRLVTESWNDKNTGEKRSKTALLIDEIGPSIRFATATVKKMERSGGQSNGGGGARWNQGGGPADDPWASTASASSGGGFGDEPPPF